MFTYAIAPCDDGGTLMGCGSGGGPAGILKLNAFGDTLFSRFYGAIGGIFAIKETSDHGIIAAGGMDTSGTGIQSDVYLVRTDSMGMPLWIRQVPGMSRDYIRDVVETSDHNFLITGQSKSVGAGQEDVLVAKIDSSGTVLWSETIGSAGSEQGLSLAELYNGNIAILGETTSAGSGGQDMLVLMLDPSGIILWQKAIGTANTDYPRNLVQTDDSLLVISGFTAGDIHLTKIDPTGALLWTKLYNSGTNAYDAGMTSTRSNGFVLCGGTAFGSYLLNCDRNGNPLWTVAYNDTAVSYEDYNIVAAQDGGYLFMWQRGAYYPAGWGEVIKTDSTGLSCMSVPITMNVSAGTFNVVTCSMVVGSFTPFSTGPGLVWPLVPDDTVVCSSATAIQEMEQEQPIGIYPNPTNGEFRLSFSSPTVGMTLVLTNLLGQEVFRAAIHQEEEVFSVSQLPTGIYSLRLLSAKRLEGSSLISVAH